MKLSLEDVYEKMKRIKVLIFDVDGVLARQEMLITEKGKLLRLMNSRDGFALRKAVEKEYQVLIITGGKSEGVISRLKGLGINEIYSGVEEKLELFEELAAAYNWQVEEVLYMGDDLPDFDVMQKVGLACCPSDAAYEIKEISHYQAELGGGRGCAREVLEMIMRSQNRW